MTNERDTETALVLFSGGVDSAVAFWWALEKGWNVVPLSFDYYRRPPGEVMASERLIEAAGGRPPLRVPLPFLKEIDDLRTESVVNPGLRGASAAYLPARNLVFYSLAAHHGEPLGARWIVGGHNGADGDTFPDATRTFFDSLNTAFKLGLLSSEASPMEVSLPLLGKTKAEVVSLGVELGVPLELTWSCWWDSEDPCGVCASCLERRNAFGLVGVRDRDGG